MAQVFHPIFNTLARASLLAAAFGIPATLWLVMLVQRSDWLTDVGLHPDQPVPFSHQHHVGGLGLDCRYCHATVETSPFAGMPATSTCMGCHARLWSESAMLAPLRESYRSGERLRWIRVHDLPDFVYFDHGIHVSKGIGCSSCHGRVDQMPLTRKVASLQMSWCLECHLHPQRQIRPRDRVFDMTWTPPANQEELGKALVQQLGVPPHLDDCYVCHR